MKRYFFLPKITLSQGEIPLTVFQFMIDAKLLKPSFLCTEFVHY